MAEECRRTTTVAGTTHWLLVDKTAWAVVSVESCSAERAVEVKRTSPIAMVNVPEKMTLTEDQAGQLLLLVHRVDTLS